MPRHVSALEERPRAARAVRVRSAVRSDARVPRFNAAKVLIRGGEAFE